MHNGQIGEFEKVRRDLAFAVCPTLFPCIKGATDSELFFYLMVGSGLAEDPLGALTRAVETVEAVRIANGLSEPFSLTAAFTDGETIYAVRYGSYGGAPSLYYGCGVPLAEIADRADAPLARAVVVLSEPLDTATDGWIEVPPGCLIATGGGAVSVSPFMAGTSVLHAAASA